MPDGRRRQGPRAVIPPLVGVRRRDDLHRHEGGQRDRLVLDRHRHDDKLVQGIPDLGEPEYFGDLVPRMLELACAGKHDETMELFWQADPARQSNASIGAIGGFNSVHRMAWKYQAWLNGYHGGPLRMPTPRLVGSQMRTLRNGLVNAGLPVTDSPDQEYWIGRNPA